MAQGVRRPGNQPGPAIEVVKAGKRPIEEDGGGFVLRQRHAQ